jgi:diadenosine tetraphosphate (Ap4A) HIT family hydrolase
MDKDMDCLSCLSNSGARRISPGPTIYDGTYWLIEHAYPCSLPGWLVIVAKRHVEALHDLTAEERAELAILQFKAIAALRETFGCRKEYLVCFAESEGFEHIHFHVVPRADGLEESLKGTKAFTLLTARGDNLTPKTVQETCAQLTPYFESSAS